MMLPGNAARQWGYRGPAFLEVWFLVSLSLSGRRRVRWRGDGSAARAPPAMGPPRASRAYALVHATSSAHPEGELAGVVTAEGEMGFGGLGQGRVPGDLDREGAGRDEAADAAHEAGTLAHGRPRREPVPVWPQADVPDLIGGGRTCHLLQPRRGCGTLRVPLPTKRGPRVCPG